MKRRTATHQLHSALRLTLSKINRPSSHSQARSFHTIAPKCPHARLLPSTSTAHMATVILGAGIIGLSTAYYLSLCPTSSEIHIIDAASTLLASASGFAGGFLAENWFSGPVASLGALSFRLHRELAEGNDGRRRWGYAGSYVYGLSVDEGGKGGDDGEGEGGEHWLAEGRSRVAVAPAGSRRGEGRGQMANPDGSPIVWTPQEGGSLETISSADECAQVEPRELCEFLLEACRARGVQVHLGMKATAVLTDEKGMLSGVKLCSTSGKETEERELKCKNVVISAGAWTPRVFETLFPRSRYRVPIESLAGHSLVVKSPRYKTPFVNPAARSRGDDGEAENWMCYSIYCAPGKYWSYAPEAFARLARDGETEIWLGGLNDSALPLPDLATEVKGMIDRASIEDLRRMTVRLTGLAKDGDDVNEDDLETIREGLCFRPVSQRGTPLIGKVSDRHLNIKTGDGGVYIASGHGPWGITLSLGTGKVMSEIIRGEKPSADVKALRVS